MAAARSPDSFSIRLSRAPGPVPVLSNGDFINSGSRESLRGIGSPVEDGLQDAHIVRSGQRAAIDAAIQADHAVELDPLANERSDGSLTHF